MQNQKSKLPLTPAQIRLLQTCADRHVESDKELAALLYISPKTVHTHFSQIEAKLLVHSRNGAVTRAQELGLITPPGPWDRKIHPREYGLEDFSIVKWACEALERAEQERLVRENAAMGTVRYTVVNGRVLGENRNGVKRDYLTDSLGSVMALVDETQTKTDTFTYWPFGEERTRTGTTPTPFRFGGTGGSYNDSTSRNYARRRVLRKDQARWLTPDPIGFAGGESNLYAAFSNSPTSRVDFTGLESCKDRTQQYCQSARPSGNIAENCFCRVSALICKLILGDSLSSGTRQCLNCINRCMFNHWKNRDTNPWGTADDICDWCGQNSFVCCAASISAEQQGLSQFKAGPCKSVCTGRGSLPFPFNQGEDWRIGHAIPYCCNPGAAPGSPLNPGDPRGLLGLR
jgi:RHS repeat-associated protein